MEIGGADIVFDRKFGTLTIEFAIYKILKKFWPNRIMKVNSYDGVRWWFFYKNTEAHQHIEKYGVDDVGAPQVVTICAGDDGLSITYEPNTEGQEIALEFAEYFENYKGSCL